MRVSGREIRVDVRPISSVLPHEETVDELASRLANQIRKDGLQRDPIIIDSATLVVLDGMHRVRALRSLGARHILCQFVDYESREVKLDRWARVAKCASIDGLLTVAKRLGVSRRVSRKEAIALLEERGTPLAVLTAQSSFVSVEKFEGIRDSFDLVRRLDAASVALGCEQEYAEIELIDAELSRRGTLVLLTPRTRKSEVLEAARRGPLFPHKSTMHMVGLRVVGVDYPISELVKKRPSRKVLLSGLKGSKISILEPPVTYLNRRYKERLLLVGRD